MDTKKSSIMQILKEYGLYIVVFIVIVVICPKFVWGKTVVDGHSMEHTLEDGDWLFNEQLSYRFGSPERFDIVVINSPIEEDHWVKRIIGLPGETIQILEGNIYINGELLEGDIYGSGPIEYSGIASMPYTIPEGAYFFMGDNRKGDVSWDSRYEEVGPVKEEEILAKVIFRTWPLNRLGPVR